MDDPASAAETDPVASEPDVQSNADSDAGSDGDPGSAAAGHQTGRHHVDLADAVDLDIALRLGRSWRELRRGGSSAVIRDYFFGSARDALEYGQMDTLDILIREPSWRMSDLAVALKVDPSTATRAVQRLVGTGLVERLTDRDDGRVVIVRITDAGRVLHREVDVRRGIVLSRLMSAFDADDRADLADLMARFVSALDEVVDDLSRVTNPE